MRRAVQRWWSRRSLRARLTLMATVLVAIGIGFAATLLIGRLQGSLVAGLDNAAGQRAADVADALSSGALGDPIPATAASDAAVQVVGPGGRVVASSGNIAGEARLFRFEPGHSGTTARTVHGTPLDDNRPFRVLVLGVDQATGRFLVYVALPADDLVHGVATLGRDLAVGGPLAVALLALASWWVIGRALEVSADKQRNFVAAAAHELRNPLASLRTQVEILQRHRSALAADADGLAELEEEVGRLSRLVDDLVQLARLDARPTLRHDVVDLDDVVFAEVRRTSRRLLVDQREVSAVRVRGDEQALGRLVRNLLDNATQHARGTVQVSLQATRRSARLVVADDGPGVPETDRIRVFERFTRLDHARGQDGGGSGLGLAIVRELVAAHGGTVMVEDNRPGARFVVELPVDTGRDRVS